MQIWDIGGPSLTASSLDDMRLGKQRLEAALAYRAMNRPVVPDLVAAKRIVESPTYQDWYGHAEALHTYLAYMCQEWEARGHKNDGWIAATASLAKSVNQVIWPWWMQQPNVFGFYYRWVHRQRLSLKEPTYYLKKFPEWLDEQMDVSLRDGRYLRIEGPSQLKTPLAYWHPHMLDSMNVMYPLRDGVTRFGKGNNRFWNMHPNLALFVSGFPRFDMPGKHVSYNQVQRLLVWMGTMMPEVFEAYSREEIASIFFMKNRSPSLVDRCGIEVWDSRKPIAEYTLASDRVYRLREDLSRISISFGGVIDEEATEKIRAVFFNDPGQLTFPDGFSKPEKREGRHLFDHLGSW